MYLVILMHISCFSPTGAWSQYEKLGSVFVSVIFDFIEHRFPNLANVMFFARCHIINTIWVKGARDSHSQVLQDNGLCPLPPGGPVSNYNTIEWIRPTPHSIKISSWILPSSSL